MKFDVDEEVWFYVDGGWTSGVVVHALQTPGISEISYVVECYGEMHEVKEDKVRKIEWDKLRRL